MPRRLAACLGLLFSQGWRRLWGGGPRRRSRSGTLVVDGPERPIRIGRDECGVPHIFAETLPDLGFGLGLAMAEDRLWQMELLRRLASGRLAEVLGDRALGGGSLHLAGPTILAVDRLYRCLGMREVARQELDCASDETRGLLDGFARGVTAHLAGARPRDLPFECLLLGVAPEPWDPADSLAVGKLIGWLLSLGFLAKPILARLASDPALHPLLPPGQAQGHCILSETFSTEAADLDEVARQALGLTGPGLGSNGWVLGGARTASGKPLLCNDPHLTIGLPALWYPVALYGPTQRVIGGTIPGVPAVLVGRNPSLAWGLTAVMADDGDYYAETLDASGAQYLRGDGWHPVEVAEASFSVRGSARAVRHTLRYVRHEGVRCPILPGGPGDPTLSYRWVGLEPWRGLDALLGMNRARNVGEFEAAVRRFALPALNVVVADAEGGIAYFCAGRFPRRPWSGRRPPILDGARPDHAWQGYLAWAEQPRAVDPAAGFLVTANNRVAQDLPGSLAAGFWEPPYRAARITELLRRMEGARLEEMAAIQGDVLSLQAAGIVGELVRPLQPRLGDPRARRAAELLLAWDGRLLAESAAAALYELFYQALLLRAVRPALEGRAPGLFRSYLSTLHLAVPAVDRALLGGEPICFPDGTPAMVEACLTAAWEEAGKRLGPDPAAWRWGTLHRLTFQHPLGRGRGRLARGLSWLFRLNRGPYARPGDGMTVNLGAFPLVAPFAVAVGPSYRQIVDLGAPESSVWIIAGGAAGDPRSPYYADQIPHWLAGETRPMAFRREDGAWSGGSLRVVPPGSPDCVVPSRML